MYHAVSLQHLISFLTEFSSTPMDSDTVTSVGILSPGLSSIYNSIGNVIYNLIYNRLSSDSFL